MKTAEHYKVIIIGGGPAGVGAAVGLSKLGIKSILILERSDKLGGIPSFYKKKKGGVRTFIRWSRGGVPVFGEDYAKWLESQISKRNIEYRLQSQVIEIEPKEKSVTVVSPGEGKNKLTSDVIIMACGSREETTSERGFMMGSRPMRVFFTKQLLQLIDKHDLLPMRNPVIIGSDLIAYAAAAKLKKAGAEEAIIVDKGHKPKCSFFERLYFRRWSNPVYHGLNALDSVSVVGSGAVTGIKLSNGEFIKCDGIAICGELIPNSELALVGNLKVNLPSRKPEIGPGYQLSEPGWFAAGNILGGFHGAEWCYFNGQRVGRSVFGYLSKSLNADRNTKSGKREYLRI